MSDKNFAIEQLEERTEQLYCYWYVGICVKWVWFIPVVYPCWKVVCYY